MPHKLQEHYSSVVLNQSQIVTTDIDATVDPAMLVQEFHLPADYRRGTESGELRYPDLSGFQLFVEVSEGCARYAAFDYEVQYQVFGLGWVTKASGTAIGAPSDGLAWMTAYFTDPIEIDATTATARWRLMFTTNGRSGSGTETMDAIVPYANGEANVFGTRIVVDLVRAEPYHFDYDGLASFLYLEDDDQVYFSVEQGLAAFQTTSPNPLALPHFDQAFDSDGDILTDTAFNFRILALSAEDGVDFLGNEYRSVVTINRANDLSTAFGADPDAYWLSKPNPSKFAIENLYFDVRRPGSTTYGIKNMVPNPSFEVDHESWIDNETGAPTSANMSVSDGWATSGERSFRWMGDSLGGATYPGFQSDPIPIKPGSTYSVRADLKAVTLPTGSDGMYLLLRFFDDDGLPVGDSPSPNIEEGEEGELVTSGIAPIDATDAMVIVFATSTDVSAVEMYLDAVCLIEGSSSDLIYFDGSMDGYVWSDTAHNSASYELIQPSAADVAAVIDRILIDPVTPGAYFTVYYTDEGDPGEDEGQWEDKLWQRIPQTYRMERRETHVFPEPVRAKYIKIEFSHLQARHYAPGNFAQPIRYKKHPKWVLDFFLARLQTDAAFLAERVSVVHDAIDLAYSYYLDDLGQEPQTAIDVSDSVATTVASFLRDRDDVSDRIDPNTLARIDLALAPYRDHPALRGMPQTLLSEYAAQTVDLNADYSVESSRSVSNPTADVSSLNRDRVVVEQNYPVMFFYLTCRHKYREIEASFSHDRAYFVGVRQIAFLRDNYMTAFDTGTYIEPAADTLNIERNEFI